MSNIKTERIGTMRFNREGDLMKCIEYNNCHDIIIEFQDEYKNTKSVSWSHFLKGDIKNPFHPSVYGIGMVGDKYSTRDKNTGIQIKEYIEWQRIIERCFMKNNSKNFKSYEKITCCKEWLIFTNFYEWIHNNEMCYKFLNDKYAIDKDISKAKIYSPQNCYLVPIYLIM